MDKKNRKSSVYKYLVAGAVAFASLAVQPNCLQAQDLLAYPRGVRTMPAARLADMPGFASLGSDAREGLKFAEDNFSTSAVYVENFVGRVGPEAILEHYEARARAEGMGIDSRLFDSGTASSASVGGKRGDKWDSGVITLTRGTKKFVVFFFQPRGSDLTAVRILYF